MVISNIKHKIIRAAKNRSKREQDKKDLRSLRTQQTSVATTNTNSSIGEAQNDANGPFILVTLPLFSTEIDTEGAYNNNRRLVNVPSLLRMSQALPHIDVPIRLDRNQNLVLRAVFDSGAGLNVGRRTYHENIRKQYPALVAQYVDLEKEDYDTPGIGGVDENAYGSAVTALVTYRTPFKFGGQPVELNFGLVEGLCARSIIGITTMQKAKMSYLVHAQVVTSEAFNFTFQVTMQKPSTDDVPPTPIRGNPAVLQTQSHTF